MEVLHNLAVKVSGVMLEHAEMVNLSVGVRDPATAYQDLTAVIAATGSGRGDTLWAVLAGYRRINERRAGFRGHGHRRRLQLPPHVWRRTTSEILDASGFGLCIPRCASTRHWPEATTRCHTGGRKTGLAIAVAIPLPMGPVWSKSSRPRWRFRHGS